MEIFKLLGTIALEGVDKAKRDLTETANTGEKAESKLTSAFKKIGTVVATAFAVSKIKSFGEACLAAYDVQMQAELKLETVMKQRMNATDEMIQSVKDLAYEQQRLGVVGDEVQLSGAQQLSTFLETDSALKTLIPAMNDLAVQQNGVNVTAEGMVNIGNLMGKVMQGQTSALSRVGISFTEAQEKVLKYGNEQERAAVLAQVITDNVGHMNAEFAKTDAGRIQQAKNNLGDLQEVIGERLQPAVAFFYETLDKVAQFVVNTALPVVDEVTQKLQTFFKPVIDGVSEAIDKVYNSASVYFPIVQNVFQSLWKAAQFVWTTIGKPIFDMLLSAVDTVRNTFAQYMPEIQQFVSQCFSDIQVFWENNLKPCLEAIGAFIENVLAPVFHAIFNERIKGYVETTFKYIQSLWNDVLKPVFTGITDFLTGVFTLNWEKAFNGLVSIVKGVVNGIINGIEHMINGAISALNGLIEGLNKTVSLAGKLLGLSVHIPTIPLLNLPRLEKGGILEKGQVGLLEGNGAEAVVPLDQNKAWVSSVAKDMQDAGIGGNNEQAQRIIELLEMLVDMLPDTLKEAFASMKFDVNNREFARLVRTVG